MKITIPYCPRYPQTEIHPMLERHRFCVLVTHRRMGKTVCAINHLIKMAVKNTKPNGQYFYIAPFLKQAKLLAWDYLRYYLGPLALVGPQRTNLLKINETELSVNVAGRFTVRLLGADNPDALRGAYADGVVLDEYGDIKPKLFDEIIRPMLVDRKGWAIFFGTPKGQNQFYDVYCHAAREFQENPDGDWWAGMYRADQTGVIAPEELEKIRRETPENTFRQEYLCDFAASAENAVFGQETLDKMQQADYPYAPGERVAALDVARYGADYSVLSVWENRGPLNWAELAVNSWNGKDLMYTVGRAVDAAKNYRFGKIIVDGDGLGGGVIDRLKECADFETVEFRGGKKAENERFANARAEAYFALKEYAEKGHLGVKNKTLLAELATLTYGFNSLGQIKMFSKEELKNAGGKSPDFADSAMMAGTLFKRAARKNLRRDREALTASANIYF